MHAARTYRGRRWAIAPLALGALLLGPGVASAAPATPAAPTDTATTDVETTSDGGQISTCSSPDCLALAQRIAVALGLQPGVIGDGSVADPVVDKPADGSTAGDPAAVDDGTGAPADDGTATGDPATGDPATGDPATGDGTGTPPATPSTGAPDGGTAGIKVGATGTITIGGHTLQIKVTGVGGSKVTITPESGTDGADGTTPATPTTDPGTTDPGAIDPGATPAATDTGTEASQVLTLVNAERATAGCDPLVEDPAYTGVEQAFAEDMAARGFFDHVNPEGLDPFERATAAGVTTAQAENIAKGQPTADEAVADWLASPKHKANIDDCALTTVGTGVATAADGTIYWAQLFGGEVTTQAPTTEAPTTAAPAAPSAATGGS